MEPNENKNLVTDPNPNGKYRFPVICFVYDKEISSIRVEWQMGSRYFSGKTQGDLSRNKCFFLINFSTVEVLTQNELAINACANLK